jgi:hypothetical protein
MSSKRLKDTVTEVWLVEVERPRRAPRIKSWERQDRSASGLLQSYRLVGPIMAYPDLPELHRESAWCSTLLEAYDTCMLTRKRSRHKLDFATDLVHVHFVL